MRVNIRTQVRLSQRELLDFVPKGLQDSARGFNPWTCAHTTTRPEGAKDFSNRRVRLAKTAYSKHRFYRPLWGGVFFYCHLGLKPQAESSSPFGTKSDGLDLKKSASQILVRKSC